ncbi:MAG TPA: cupin domain-containing protein [Nitrospiraceae bacterium]|nr:cupin domain-containing protein [Nitrospiraceae bacterium]
MNNLQGIVSDRTQLPTEKFAWGTLQWLCNDQLSPGALQTVGLCQLLPGHRSPRHFHPNCEEVLHLLAGAGRHSFDGELIQLQTGSTIRIPPGVRHNLVNTSSETLVCLIVFSSGRRETVFLE